MSFVKLLIGWALAMAIYSALIQAWYAATGDANSGFVEGLLGLGVLLVVPSFLFAVIVGWPAMSWLGGLRPAWLMALVAGAALASLMWGLTSLMLPDDWRGAGHALVGYAAVLGLVLACLDLNAAPASLRHD